MDRRQADGSRAWVDLPLWQAQTPACEQACPFGKTTGQRGEQAGRWPGIDCTHALPEARSRFPACTTKGQAPAYHPRGQAHGCAAGRWPSLRDPSFRDSTRTAPHPHPASLALGHSRTPSNRDLGRHLGRALPVRACSRLREKEYRRVDVRRMAEPSWPAGPVKAPLTQPLPPHDTRT